jgi:hypothetical protein
MNSNLYVITASNPSAKQHIDATIEHPIPPGKVEPYFIGDELDQVKKVGISHGYYAWGATPGPINISNWQSMHVGDHVLIYQDKMYTYCTAVVFKQKNRDFALAN